jgi:hypothetical protein
VGLAQQLHPKKFSLGLFDHLTLPGIRSGFWRRPFFLIPMVARLVVDRNELILGGDVTGECDAGSPGSGGASPYLRRGFPRQPAHYFALWGFNLEALTLEPPIRATPPEAEGAADRTY